MNDTAPPCRPLLDVAAIAVRLPESPVYHTVSPALYGHRSAVLMPFDVH